jgi:hypothetical protein
VQLVKRGSCVAGSIFRRSPSPVGPGTRAKAPYALTYKNPTASGSGANISPLHQFCKILRALKGKLRLKLGSVLVLLIISVRPCIPTVNTPPSSAPCFIQAHPDHSRFPALRTGSHQGKLVLQLGGRPQDAQGVGRQLGVGGVDAPCGQQGVRTAAQGEGGVHETRGANV